MQKRTGNPLLCVPLIVLGIAALACGSTLPEVPALVTAMSTVPSATKMVYPTLAPEWTATSNDAVQQTYTPYPTETLATQSPAQVRNNSFCPPTDAQAWSIAYTGQTRQLGVLSDELANAKTVASIVSTQRSLNALVTEVASTPFPLCAKKAQNHWIASLNYLSQTLTDLLLSDETQADIDTNISVTEAQRTAAVIQAMAACAPDCQPGFDASLP